MPSFPRKREPRFCQLRKALDQEVVKRVTREVPKDLSALDTRELEKRLDEL